MDGLSDALEMALGSNPQDADSDDDGVPDGAEANLSNDEDGDGSVNMLDADSDGDGLFDGTETGHDCDGPGTKKMAGVCIPDGDMGKTKTSMVDKDSDDGGYSDGDEDFDKDGVYDANQGEGNPNFKEDDLDAFWFCQSDTSCGMPNDGYVCDEAVRLCVPGCWNTDSGRCPDGQMCTSSDDMIGDCVSVQVIDAPLDEGCSCGVPGDPETNWWTGLLAVVAAAAACRRRGARPRRA